MVKGFCEIISLVLLVSMFLHLGSYNHQHPKYLETNNAIANIHGEDKKLWSVFSVFQFFDLSLSLNLLVKLLFVSFAPIICILGFRLKNYLLQNLSRGRLQPKLCN